VKNKPSDQKLIKNIIKMLRLISVCLLVVIVNAEVYLDERFDDGDAYKARWIQSTHKSDYGEFVLTAGKFYGDAEKDKGIQTSQDAKFYSYSRKLDKNFNNEGKDLVLQFTVKHEQNIDCGGGYVKLFDDSVDPADFHGETEYQIMFGPDICGPGTKKVHVIFNYKGKNHLIKKEIRCKDDEFTHLYTLIVKPDNTYEVLIDLESAQKGELEADWDFLPPKKIKDPEASKPEDWDDRAKIDDPEDSKPEDWDQPEHISDPDAKKPDDWDDDMDGEWEPPMIDNPDYKGEWKPKQIDNPAYKGVWKHPEIDNPEYQPDDALYKLKGDSAGIAFDLWQVKSGTIFDNILITDDIEHAKAVGKELFTATKDAEKAMKEAADEEERKKAEEEEKAAGDDKDDDDEDEDYDESMDEEDEAHDEL